MSELTIQGGPNSFVLSRDPKLGVIGAKVLFHAPDLATALLPAPNIGVNIPEWNPRAVTRRASGTREGYDVLISYEGHPEPEKAKEESFEVDGSTSENPIETHWNLEVLLKNYKGKFDANQRAKWPLNLTDESGMKRKNRMHGVESWPEPGLVWNHNFVSQTLPENLIKTLGVITRNPPGNPPQLDEDRDWMVARIRATQRGNIWQIQVSYALSGPGGSVPEMYHFA